MRKIRKSLFPMVIRVSKVTRVALIGGENGIRIPAKFKYENYLVNSPEELPREFTVVATRVKRI